MPRWGCSIKKYLCEKSLEEDMAINSRILAWSILWTKEPGGLQSMELQRVRHEWSDLTHTHEKQVDFCNILQNLSGLRASLFLTHSPPKGWEALLAAPVQVLTEGWGCFFVSSPSLNFKVISMKTSSGLGGKEAEVFMGSLTGHLNIWVRKWQV